MCSVCVTLMPYQHQYNTSDVDDLTYILDHIIVSHVHFKFYIGKRCNLLVVLLGDILKCIHFKFVNGEGVGFCVFVLKNYFVVFQCIV